MNVIDVTRPLSGGVLIYPGDKTPSFRQTDNGRYLISDLHMSSHTGTHIDAPSHYLKEGQTIDAIPLSHLLGRCRVIDLSRTGKTRITSDDLEDKIRGAERLLLKTWFSGKDSFIEDYPCLDIAAASLITGSGIACVGIDSPSIESFNCDGSVHCKLLSHGCIIIELLDLSGVPEGDYEMAALPLRLTGLDGSPARVILRKPEEVQPWT